MRKILALPLIIPALKNPAIALFRPFDHIFFTIPLVVIGFCTAVRIEGVLPNLSILVALLIANILAMSFAFAINEVEDAPDDKNDPHKSNPVARGLMNTNEALILTFLTLTGSFTIFIIAGSQAATAGLLMLALAFLYSYKGVRLKSIPALDLLSHGLMLSGLIFLSSYLAVSKNINHALPIFLGVTAVSIYGQFYNQIRDFKEDREANIKNTTSLVGLTDAKRIMYSLAIIGALLMAYSFYSKLLPIIPLLLTLLAIPITLKFRGISSKRDKNANLAGTDIHIPFLILVNTFGVIFLLSLFT